MEVKRQTFVQGVQLNYETMRVAPQHWSYNVDGTRGRGWAMPMSTCALSHICNRYQAVFWNRCYIHWSRQPRVNLGQHGWLFEVDFVANPPFLYLCTVPSRKYTHPFLQEVQAYQGTGRLIANGEFSFEYTPTRGLKSRFTLCSMTILHQYFHSMNISLTTTML